MTYTPDIPLSGESLGSTRDRTRGNFQEIAAVEAINHVAFNTTGKGKHKFLQMPEVTASGAGVPATLTNEGGVYVDVAINPAEANLFFRGENNGFNYQMTAADQTNSGVFGNNTTYTGAQAFEKGGWTFLPGGLIMQYGSVLPGQNTSSSGTTKFPKPFTAPPFLVMATPVTRSSGVSSNQERVISIRNTLSTTTQFQWNWETDTASYVGFNWIAIGL